MEKINQCPVCDHRTSVPICQCGFYFERQPLNDQVTITDPDETFGVVTPQEIQEAAKTRRVKKDV